MPSARNIRAGAAYIELYAHDNRLVKGLHRASRRPKAFSASVRRIGMQLAKVSAVFATPLIAGVKVFADFEQQMANVSTMLDEPDKHMARFRQGIRDMSVEFGESTETLAKGLYDILSASVPAEHARRRRPLIPHHLAAPQPRRPRLRTLAERTQANDKMRSDPTCPPYCVAFGSSIRKTQACLQGRFCLSCNSSGISITISLAS